ncbi:MAG: hypothetical protein KatS3mg062_1041 [Tepidiforma sp.]|nr:MAG: hypothetical protein KatS3mg062_1041 [Tepidiforma sp.]
MVDPEPAGPFPAPRDRRRVAILLELEGREPDAAYTSSLIRLRGSDGTSYTWTLTNQQPPLRAGRLQAGERTTGRVAFDLPLAVAPAALGYGNAASIPPLLSLEA